MGQNFLDTQDDLGYLDVLWALLLSGADLGPPIKKKIEIKVLEA